ncbi:MAG: polyphosphate kinase 1 [Bacteroidota bacterium]
MENTIPYIHRDISWLSFNYRVLQEAKDPALPLFERVKFLAIYSNNLDEYFRVRVAQHRSLIRVGKKTKKKLDYDPKELLSQIKKIVNDQQEEFSDIFENQIVPELTKYKIYLLRRLDLNARQQEFVEDYFRENLLPFVQPVLLLKHKIRPFLNNAALYLTIRMEDKDPEITEERYAVIKIPSDHLPRFIHLPSSAPGRKDIIMLDDIVRHSVKSLFPGYEIQDTYSIKITRDADLYIEDEFSGDLVGKIKSSLNKRNIGPPSRLVIDREMPKNLRDFLLETFHLEKRGILVEGRYHNNFDFFKFPDFGLSQLKNIPFPPLPYKPLEKANDFFTAMRSKDHIIHVPYQSYESVVLFFEKAAVDDAVTHIKIIQYRVAGESRIMKALMRAVRNGKQVSAFIELKARFDEEANLKWGEILEKAGVEVHYSFPGLKVHSKSALIIREERRGKKMYAYMSTGNFHEGTAKIYSDLGLFTTDRRITTEVARLFSYLETVKAPTQSYKNLLVGQFGLLERLIGMIDREIEHAKAGKEARIVLKMNSLQDEEMVEKLYEASNAGVKIDLIIRGICSLVPSKKGWSENINAISIVDRFLEHARIFLFHNDGAEDIYLSSADWMSRNLRRRIETAFPIYKEDIKKEIKEILRIQLEDNVKARIIDEADSNAYKQSSADLSTRSQVELYYYYKRQGEKQ